MSSGSSAFVTLLTTDSYLPGALVLLHSLIELHPAPRDFKIVALVTPETVDAKSIGELRRAGYDLVIGVEPIGSGKPGQQGLDLMGMYPLLSLPQSPLLRILMNRSTRFESRLDQTTSFPTRLIILYTHLPRCRCPSPPPLSSLVHHHGSSSIIRLP